MTERLSDEMLNNFERRIGSEFDNEVTLTGDELRALLAELRARRARDLTSEERNAPQRQAMTRKQLDRAILALFNMDEPCVRSVMPANLYDYAWGLWSKTKQGARESAWHNRRRRSP
jgi:hypothetical protein